MPRDSTDLLFPSMARVKQPNDYYCGPAVLEMLASYQEITVPQEQFVIAAGIGHKIKNQGMFLSEMSVAVAKLLPDCAFWFKRESTISELSSLINTYGYPVGVEWQGTFEDDQDDEEDEEEGDGDDDPGHYSVVTGISTADNWVTLADPYHNRGIDKQLTILEFERRWWDINQVTDPVTGRHYEQDDYHALFVITRKDDATPELFGMSQD